ncbi:MAG: FAD-dependent oxidoreductase [Elusimicrobia bacterium]|nr:FAD-dependent oxidoreductase [Elusimicrobiota bacterium]
MGVLILGAGLCGLSAAHHLQKDWTILEKNLKVGGLAGSDRVKGFTFDKTGHLLHMHHPYTKGWLIENLLKDKLLHLKRDSWIFSNGVFTRYPYQANTFGLPPKVVRECLVAFLQARDRGLKPVKDPSFERWCLQTFGKGISRYFMLPYNSKLWRIDLKKMTTEWIRDFVPIPSREEVLYGALTDQKKFFGYNATFFYPKEGGIQGLPDAMAAGLNQSRLFLNTQAIEIHWERREVAASDGRSYPYDWLISTIPLHELLEKMRPRIPERLDRARGEALKYTVVYNLNLGLSNPKPTDKHWVYFPENKFRFYRIGISSNFAPALALPGTSSYYCEFSRRKDESFDEKGMFDHVISMVRELGWMRPVDEVVVARWLRIAPAYVIYTKKRRKFLPEAFEFLERQNIISTGRYGAWKYSFMEEAVLDGKAAAERVLAAGHATPVL